MSEQEAALIAKSGLSQAVTDRLRRSFIKLNDKVDFYFEKLPEGAQTNLVTAAQYGLTGAIVMGFPWLLGFGLGEVWSFDWSSVPSRYDRHGMGLPESAASQIGGTAVAMGGIMGMVGVCFSLAAVCSLLKALSATFSAASRNRSAEIDNACISSPAESSSGLEIKTSVACEGSARFVAAFKSARERHGHRTGVSHVLDTLCDTFAAVELHGEIDSISRALGNMLADSITRMLDTLPPGSGVPVACSATLSDAVKAAESNLTRVRGNAEKSAEIVAQVLRDNLSKYAFSDRVEVENK